jgi:hypothetical protein
MFRVVNCASQFNKKHTPLSQPLVDLSKIDWHLSVIPPQTGRSPPVDARVC